MPTLRGTRRTRDLVLFDFETPSVKSMRSDKTPKPKGCTTHVDESGGDSAKFDKVTSVGVSAKRPRDSP